MPRKIPSLALGAALMTLFAGCSGEPFPLAPAGGRVTIDGAPFTTGKVMFSPLAAEGETLAGRSAIGVLDAEGRFTLGTNNYTDGAVIGDHRVEVINTADDKSVAGFKRYRVPGGTMKVSADGGNDFVIELTSRTIRGGR